MRSILAATDLGTGSDRIVASAARLAERSGAELHLIHALELSAPPSGDVAEGATFSGMVEAAKEGVREQVERTMPVGFTPASEWVIIHSAHRAIRDRAQDVAADLIVVGPHRGGAAGARILGTTADRVIRTSEVPCLVVREPLADRALRIGVPVDFSGPSDAALEAALDWALREGGAQEREGGGGEVQAVHVAQRVEGVEESALEERMVGPHLERQVDRALSATAGSEALRVGREVLWGEDVSDRVVSWAAERELDLLVMGTHGRGALARALIGSVASSVAREAHCAVLLVPPSAPREPDRVPRLDRVLVAVDLSDRSAEAAAWSTAHLAPAAEHVLLHVVDALDAPEMLAAGPSPEELLATARGRVRERLEAMGRSLRAAAGPQAPVVRTEVREGRPAQEIGGVADEVGADLVVMGGHTRGDRGGFTGALLGSTADRVLRSAAVPVLVTRALPQAAPRRILAAVDGSSASLRALAWASLLARRTDGSLTALAVELPLAYAYAGVLMESPELGVPAGIDVEGDPERLRRREERLREEVRQAGVDPDAATLRVVEGRPADRILDVREQVGADLVVMGTHGRGTLGRVFLGSVSGAVLRAAPCPVLVVPDGRS